MVAPMQLAAPSAWAWTRAGRVWLATLGRAGLGRAMPAWLGAAIVGGAVFGGNGLAPRDVAALAAGAPRVIAVVACGWLVLLTRWPALFVLLALLLAVGAIARVIRTRRRLAAMPDDDLSLIHI